MAVNISSRLWGQPDDKSIYLFKVENDSGGYVELSNYGATVVSVVVPNRQQQPGHVIIGFPDLDSYLNDTNYIGATIGRYANRISNAGFSIDANYYQLNNNDGKNCNHGGTHGFNKKVFEASVADDKIIMALKSADGEGGFPGNLELTVTYTWNDYNELLINYRATSDKPTIANFTNHSYFNLSGFNNNINHQKLIIKGNLTLHSRPDHTVSGAILPAGPKAFNNDKLSDKFQTGDAGIKGLNLFYIIDKAKNETGLMPAAKLSDETSGRTLEVYTDYPGLFLYTGDYLSGSALTHTGRPVQPFDGLCLECQHYPDSINNPNFPQAILQPGDTYNQHILFKFGQL
ncbi:galactose mutarotase [Mucilaginibacter terrigena]|uniref:Aldose 1-epimerase n=1 Tax=Mucilaginibacter terrigena TaxID=2492395 RepID=A0A4Q5LJW1_9SPHI|nr:aldose epimerase family protein [Mucilaginibacter terrigena]RYU89615.1 galactose mutarotase [Mucilaginibacter terrigena]